MGEASPSSKTSYLLLLAIMFLIVAATLVVVVVITLSHKHATAISNKKAADAVVAANVAAANEKIAAAALSAQMLAAQVFRLGSIINGVSLELISENENTAHLATNHPVSLKYNRIHNGLGAVVIVHKIPSANSVWRKKKNNHNKNATFSGTIRRQRNTTITANTSPHAKRDFDANQCYSVNDLRATIVSGMNWTLDTNNPYGLNPDWIAYSMRKQMDVWQSITSYRIFGNYNQGTLSNVNISAPANTNGARYATIVDSHGSTNTILAFTITWYQVVSGFTKIVRWNQVYNTQVDYPWGDVTLTRGDVFDNPATMCHELGHAGGMLDVTDSRCNFVTMYFSGGIDDIEKRDLAQGDINGYHVLYPTGVPNTLYLQVRGGETAPAVYATTPSSPVDQGGEDTQGGDGGGGGSASQQQHQQDPQANNGVKERTRSREIDSFLFAILVFFTLPF